MITLEIKSNHKTWIDSTYGQGDPNIWAYI